MIKTVSCGMTDHLRHTCKLNSITLGKCLLRFLSGLHLLRWFLLSVIMMRFSNTDFTFSPSPLLSLSPILSRVMFVCLCVKCFTYFVISFLLWNVSLNKVERISLSLSVCILFCLSQPQVIASVFTGHLIVLFFIPHRLILVHYLCHLCKSLLPIRRALLSLRNTICSRISI